MANNKESCQHPSVYGTLCVVCGAEVGEGNEKEDDYHTILHDNAFLKMNKSNRDMDATLQSKELKTKKKLVCILDLDQTILHCLVGNQDPDGKVLFFVLQNIPYNIYFRPHLSSLLGIMSNEYITHIYTMGTNEYCEQIKNHMAIKMKFDVESRWMGRDLNILPGEQAHMKSINRFNCPVDYTVVLDDRLEVWKQQGNVIPILPYYHALTGDIHGSDRFKLFQNVVFRMDNHLVYIDRLLKAIHNEFYKVDSNGDVISKTVPDILNNCLDIFKDCYFVLSGFIPNTKGFVPIINLIEKYGGIVMESPNDKTTHCICMYTDESNIINEDQFQAEEIANVPESPDEDVQIIDFLLRKSALPFKITDKVKAAKYRAYLLPPEWVYLSCYSYYKLDENVFNYENMLPTDDPIARSKQTSGPVRRASNSNSATVGRNRTNSATPESSISSDMDSFANELENNLG